MAPVEKTFDDVFFCESCGKGGYYYFILLKIIFQIISNSTIIFFQIAPELIYANESVNIHGGVTPAWDNGKLSVFSKHLWRSTNKR